MSLWLSSQPLWLSGLIVVGITTALAMLGPRIVRRSISLERLVTNNEVAGFKYAVLGVIYAVMLGFTVIVVWKSSAMPKPPSSTRQGRRKSCSA